MYRVIIKPDHGQSFRVSLCETKAQFKRWTVEELWGKITEEDDSYRPNVYELYFRGTRLDDDDGLYDVGIRNGSEIELIYRGPLLGSATGGRRRSMDRLDDFDRCSLQ